MGFLANWKAKRAYKSAMAQYDLAITDWHTDVEIFQKIKDAFLLAAKGEDVVVNQTIQKAGEIVLWTAKANSMKLVVAPELIKVPAKDLASQ